MVKLHPVTVMLYNLCFIFMIMTYDHPLIVAALSLVIFFNVVAIEASRNYKKMLRGSFYTAGLIFLINPLVSASGATPFFSFALPLLGARTITLEGIVFGAVMGAKVVAVTLICILYAALNDSDESFSFFSRYAHQLTLTFSMTLNMMHRLSLDVKRVRDVMVLRGVDFRARKLGAKVKAYYPLLKVLLISALEGSLNRAEALYSKGYGQGNKRSSYTRLSFHGRDYVFILLCASMLGLYTVGILYHLDLYVFYPRLGEMKVPNLIFAFLLAVPAVTGAGLLKGRQRWTFLK